MKRILFALAIAVFTLGLVWAQDQEYANLKFLVVKDSNGKPVRNASVVLHKVSEEGKQEKGGLQLKTDAEGETKYEGIPYGKLRVQVIARGLQTFGQDYDVNQPEMQFTIKMKPPQEQYSIYK